MDASQAKGHSSKHNTDPLEKTISFGVKIDGVDQKFGNFHFYKQPIIDDVMPLVAPNDGKGVIYVMGRGFRNDFENANIGCRVGNVLA